MKLKKVMLLTAAFMLAASMTACSQKQDTQPSQNETSQTEDSSEGKQEVDEGAAVQGSAVEPQEEIPANQNLLTGVPDLTDGAIGKRPVAVMVNNVSYAMPQYGVGQADIIFEIPVEGDATRFMALYGDYTQAVSYTHLTLPTTSRV